MPPGPAVVAERQAPHPAHVLDVADPLAARRRRFVGRARAAPRASRPSTSCGARARPRRRGRDLAIDANRRPRLRERGRAPRRLGRPPASADGRGRPARGMPGRAGTSPRAGLRDNGSTTAGSGGGGPVRVAHQRRPRCASLGRSGSPLAARRRRRRSFNPDVVAAARGHDGESLVGREADGGSSVSTAPNSASACRASGWSRSVSSASIDCERQRGSTPLPPGPSRDTTTGRSPTCSTSDSPSSRTMAASRESTRCTHVSDGDVGRNALRH